MEFPFVEVLKSLHTCCTVQYHECSINVAAQIYNQEGKVHNGKKLILSKSPLILRICTVLRNDAIRARCFEWLTNRQIIHTYHFSLIIKGE
jgi:hypothetical protein